MHLDPGYSLFLQTLTDWLYRDICSYDFWCISRSGRDHYPCIQHAMGSIGLRPSLLAYYKLHGSYWRQCGGHMGYGDDVWSTRDGSIARLALGVAVLLYNRLVDGVWLADYCVSLRGEEKLYT